MAITRGTGCGVVCAEFISLIFYRGLTNQRGMRSKDITWVIIGSAKNVPRGTSWVETTGLGSKYVPRGTMRPAQAVLERKPQAFQDLRQPTGPDFRVEVRSRPRTRPV